MSFVRIGPLAAAVAVAFGTAVLAQAGQSPSQPQAPQAPQVSMQGAGAGQKVTVTGCVQRESDYRKAQDAGRGGVAGSGVGVGNEFVLTSATTESSAGAPSPSAQSAPSAGASGPGTAYELTGKNEGMAAQHVGRRVEIGGMLKAAETGASGAPTGGPTAGRPPSGVDVVSKDLQLRELEVDSIREVGATCPAM
jgi:hypothetical protein